MVSALIIHRGNIFWRNPAFLTITLFYVLFEAIAWSFDLQLISNSNVTPNLVLALQNGFIVLPLVYSLVYYIPVLQMIPDQKNKVRTMLAGLSLAIIGQTINAIWNYLNNESSLIGLVIVLIGVFVATISFTNFFDRISETKTIKNAESSV